MEWQNYESAHFYSAVSLAYVVNHESQLSCWATSAHQEAEVNAEKIVRATTWQVINKFTKAGALQTHKVNDSKFIYFPIVHTCLNVLEAKPLIVPTSKNFLNMHMIQD